MTVNFKWKSDYIFIKIYQKVGQPIRTTHQDEENIVNTPPIQKFKLKNYEV